MTDELARSSLESQYGHVLAEYRFQVQLNWDRSKHFFTFNTVLFGAAVALYSQGELWPTRAGVAVLLLIAALNSFHGAWAIDLGHEYYRRVRRTKALLEERLALGNFAIQSTPGMRRDVDEVAEGTPRGGARRFRRITEQSRLLLMLIGALSGCGALYATYATYQAFSALSLRPAQHVREPALFDGVPPHASGALEPAR